MLLHHPHSLLRLRLGAAVTGSGSLAAPFRHPQLQSQPQVRHFRLAAAAPLLVPDAPAIDNGLDACPVLMPPPVRLFAIAPPAPFREPAPAAAPVAEAAEPTSSVETNGSELPESPESTDTSTAGSNSSPQWSMPEFTPPTLDELAARIPDEYRQRAATLKQDAQNWGKEFMGNAAKNFTLLGMKVNEVTGYREVERLKLAVKEREHDLNLRRVEVKSAKSEYEHAVLDRSTSQQNVNNLLERKHSWSDNDVAEFTRLVRSDHASRHAVTTTSQDLKTAEMAVDKAFTSLMQSILERYHEEQVWSDKIRSVSTWANIVALAANLIVFMGAIAFIEPWKRRRLVQGLEERMTGMMQQVDEELKILSANIETMRVEAAAAGAAALPTAGPTAADTAVAPAEAPAELAPSPPVAPVEPDSISPAPPVTETAEPAEPPTPVSPIEQLSLDAEPDSRQSKVLGWVTTQLSHVGPASAERDLAAASLVGAVGGAVTVGLISLVMSSFR